MIDQKNLILAVVLSVTILFAFELLFETGRPVTQPQAPVTTEATAPGAPGAPSAPAGAADPALPGTPAEQTAPVQSADGLPAAPGGLPQIPGRGTAPAHDRAAVLKQSPRVAIETPSLSGSISLKGARVDDLKLIGFHEDLDPKSPAITLLNPKGAVEPFFGEFGWVAAPGVKIPTRDTVWAATSGPLTPEQPVTLTWENGEGLTFKIRFEIDSRFMITATQTVANAGDEAAVVYPYGLVSRFGTPEISGFFILHEGLLGVADGTLTEVDYSDLQGEPPVSETATGGWLGITDKYWQAVLIPSSGDTNTRRYSHRIENNVDVYQVDYRGSAISVAPGGEGTSTSRFFAGAKQTRLIDAYEKELGIERFDLAIDWGWFYFLTKPIFYGLVWINDLVGNFGVSILLLTVGIKLIFFPLANKSYVSMSKLKKLTPQMNKLRERYENDKVKLQQEMMALYKKEGANPAAGCLPILIQIPVFFALYKVLFVTIEMRHAPFFGWIQDLSAPDPTSLFNLFGLIPWTPPDFLLIGIWPVLMGASMYLQQKMNPQPQDPIQAKIFLFLPLLFTFLLATFPAGLVIYWTWNNLLSIAQQWVIMRRMGVSIND